MATRNRPQLSRRKKRRSGLSSLIELVLTVAIAVGLALAIQAFVVKPYRIPSPSMTPTLAIGQRVLANRLAGHPKIGDIVVFHPPAGADPYPPVCGNPNQGSGHQQACDKPTAGESSQTFIKRVVAGPGDVLRIVNGRVYRDGKLERGSWSCQGNAGVQCTFPRSIKVPAGEYFMMGDNRGVSDDSRFWGPVPDSWIIGVAFFTYWPPDRVGTL